MNLLPKPLSSPIARSFLTRNSRETFIINRAFGGALSTIGFSNFTDVWNYPEGEIIKRKNNRSVSRIYLNYPIPEKNSTDVQTESRPRAFFLKRHKEPIKFREKIHQLLRPGKTQGEELREFENYCHFRNNGLATAVPVAGGMQRKGSTLRSFLITMDFSPLYTLEDVILQQPEQLESLLNQEKRKNILATIAAYARQMHQAGMNQKDFNATHILIDDIDSPEPAIALFDLQHVDRKISNRFRWPIKALAELNVSLPAPIFSEHDRTFLFMSYKKKAQLDFLDKIQYNWIVKKTGRIRRHTLKNNLAPKSNQLDEQHGSKSPRQ